MVPRRHIIAIIAIPIDRPGNNLFYKVELSAHLN